MKKIFLGPPGSGKGTAASRVAPKNNIPHISTGDLFRKNIKEKTPIGIKAQEYLDSGRLVPDDIVIKMLKERISQKDCEDGFILDGFPRTLQQAKKLKKLTKMDLAINMDVPDEILVKRLSSRISCSDCGKIYNTRTIIPKQEGICDVCKGPIIKRKDDEPEVIKKRLDTYNKHTKPLIDFYKDFGILKNVICDNIEQTPEETFQEVLKIIEEFNKESGK